MDEKREMLLSVNGMFYIQNKKLYLTVKRNG